MDESRVVSALLQKRAELLCWIETTEERLAATRADLQHLDGALRLFSPEWRPDPGKRRRHGGRRGLFANGELTRRLLGIMRDAGQPLEPGEIVDRIVADKGLANAEQRAVVARGVSRTLNTLRASGHLEAVTDADRVIQWRVRATDER